MLKKFMRHRLFLEMNLLKQYNEIIINLELFVKFNYLINLNIMAYIFAFFE